MNNLYKPVSLPFASDLVAYTKKHMDQFNTDRVHIQNIPVPENEWNDWNAWLNSKGISNLLNALSFKRKQSPKNVAATHIDFFKDNVVIHNSIVIPVEGCRDTYQYWFGGEFNAEPLATAGGDLYMKIHWTSPPTYLGNVEIFDSPMLCRTDVPHNAENIHNVYRTTVTVRFEANETFEYLAERLST